MKFILVASAVVVLNLLYPMSVEAVSDDDELSIMAAEQREENDANVTVKEDIEIFESRSAGTDINSGADSSSAVSTTISTEDSKDSKITEADDVTQTNTDVIDEIKKNDTLQNSTNEANPIVAYSNFEDAVKKVGYIPLYIPRKSGFAMNYIGVLNGNVVEIRYGKRWEPTVTLAVRTYKRSPGEELKDISGVHGVKWKVDLSSGMTLYIARVDNHTNAAAWSVGQYTFAAMAENMSFAAFHAFIVEELVDLCNHYFIQIQ